MRTRLPSLIALFAAALAGASSVSPLADAARSGDAASLRSLIGAKSDVNAPQPDGTTALHWAVHRDDAAATGLLLRHGANPKAVNHYGVSPLALACTNGNAGIVRLLLEAGADPNAVLPGGETPLMTAARTGNVDVVRLLIARGAAVNAQEESRGQTALMWAAADGNVEVVKELLRAGADPRRKLPTGFTPLLFAVREGRMETVRALLDVGADVNDAVEAPSVKSRLASGAGSPKPGTTPLILAAINGHYELAAYLLDRGADPDSTGPGYTALHTVTWVRKPGGGDNDPAPQGSGKLTSLDFVRKLAAKGANLNARMTKRVAVGLTGLNTLGATAFLLAARSGDAELMRVLASLGADPLLPNADNSTPLIVAAGLGTRSPGEDAGTEPEVLEAVQVALELGNDINAVDDKGETAMHGAAYKNYPAVVEFLAAKGARPEVWNQKNKHGWTPLIIAQGYRFGNFKPSADTEAMLRRVMREAGVTAIEDAKPVGAGRNSNYVPKP